MLCISLTTTNPFFNIAAEEHFLKSATEDVFMLYVNEPSVVVGKHQNSMAEIDINYVTQNNLRVVRRLSGGGAVYHDLGNLNFCFIRSGEPGKLVNFRFFAEPIIKFLGTLGVDATFEGHNSILVNGFKVSGNAEHIFKQRVMHHGTLLFDTNQQALAKALYVNESRFTHRAVRSVRASTANLTDFIVPRLNIGEFRMKLMEFMLTHFSNAHPYTLSAADIEHVDKLVGDKYGQWDWNFGYSPSYSFKREINAIEGVSAIEVQVDNGVISRVGAMLSAPTDLLLWNSLEQALVGRQHTPRQVEKALIASGVDNELRNELLVALF